MDLPRIESRTMRLIGLHHACACVSMHSSHQCDQLGGLTCDTERFGGLEPRRGHLVEEIVYRPRQTRELQRVLVTSLRLGRVRRDRTRSKEACEDVPAQLWDVNWR